MPSAPVGFRATAATADPPCYALLTGRNRPLAYRVLGENSFLSNYYAKLLVQRMREITGR